MSDHHTWFRAPRRGTILSGDVLGAPPLTLLTLYYLSNMKVRLPSCARDPVGALILHRANLIQ